LALQISNTSGKKLARRRQVARHKNDENCKPMLTRQFWIRNKKLMKFKKSTKTPKMPKLIMLSSGLTLTASKKHLVLVNSSIWSWSGTNEVISSSQRRNIFC
jgi:hypothetical protein